MQNLQIRVLQKLKSSFHPKAEPSNEWKTKKIVTLTKISKTQKHKNPMEKPQTTKIRWIFEI
jgi:hypothetical protein